MAKKAATAVVGGEELTEILREAMRGVRSLREGTEDRWLFPRGIDFVRLSVELPSGKLEVSLSGGPEAPTAAVSQEAADFLFEPPPGDLQPDEKVPNAPEKTTVGPATTKIKRATPEFNALTSNQNPAVVFKDEEGTGADRMMTAKLSARIDALAALVGSEWSGKKLRVTEAWDENDEHGANSIHYEARAVDLTTQPIDQAKLGRLGRLAVNAGFEWVFFETNHIHASMSK